MSFGLSKEIVYKIRTVFAKYPQITSVILYGSRAKGTYKTGSDIDLTLKGRDIDLHVLNNVSNDLDDLLTPYTFDLSIFNNIKNSDLLEHIERVGIEFYHL